MREHPALDPRLIVAGAHLSPAFGHTVDEIRAAGFPIEETLECLLSSDTDVGMAKTTGLRIERGDMVIVEEVDGEVAVAEKKLVHRVGAAMEMSEDEVNLTAFDWDYVHRCHAGGNMGQRTPRKEVTSSKH